MKARESGMPERVLWESFFEPTAVLRQLGLTRACVDVLEFGSGYGTFTIPAAQIAVGTVHAIDIDASMIRAGEVRAARTGVSNAHFVLRDFVQCGSGLESQSIDFAMLFNILHCSDPLSLLTEARRNLNANGSIAVMHWNYDPTTPRGPPMDIRPQPGDVANWAGLVGLSCGPRIDLPPYHYGFVLTLPI